MSPVHSPRPRLCAVLLGGFIVWQLGFILAANLLPLLHQAQPRESDPLEETLGHWSNLTGQLQGWCLYAPFVPTQATFVAVELRWDDAADWPANGGQVVRLRSAIEPSDPCHYFRPFCTFRLPAYEANLGLVMWAWNEEKAAREPELWRQRIAAAVRRQWKPMRAYLQWRLASFAEEHPAMPPPTQAILLARIYRIPPPDRPAGDWSGPVERPIARWRPGADVPCGCLPLESYNLAANRFEWITNDK